MIIQCQSCSRKFIVKDSDIPINGRTVQCGYCSVSWHQIPIKGKTEVKKIEKVVPKISKLETNKTEEGPSVDSIKASDGKTYKFLGTQWAVLLPSGKTGLFAKKKISQELDEITGRKKKRTTKKRRKKIEEVNPSSIDLNPNKQLPKIYEPKQGLGFFGYIFLIIIIGFSIVGVLRTFENDLLNLFPEIEFIYELLDEQLVFLAETVKNMLIIVNDLISDY
jgi:predicted Zn finger-like uncharacterized protein